MEAAVHILILGAELESLGVGVDRLLERVAGHGRLRHLIESEVAGLGEIDVGAAEDLLLIGGTIQGDGLDCGRLFAGHQGEGLLVDTRGKVSSRVGISLHISLGELHPRSGLGAFLGVKGRGFRLLDRLLDVGVGLDLCVGYLNGGNEREGK